MNTRYLAAKVIAQVLQGHSLSEVLEPTLAEVKEPRDRGFVQALCYGVCRFYPRLKFVLNQLLDQGLKAKDRDLEALLLVGLYQLMDMRVAQHAAVAETVNAVKKLKKPTWARGLTNAVLRNFLRQQAALEVKWQKNEEAVLAHPYWWIKSIKEAYPSQYQEILKENNQHPPFVLRVNQRKISREDYLQKLQAAEIEAHSVPETQSGIVLTEAVSVERLPGFADGEVSVQDAAAQVASESLEIADGMRVLDACAAPGGKLTHILELADDLEVVAVEKEARRCKLVQQNLERLGLTAKCQAADAAKPDAWWDGELFDRILLDAPCSSSGVIRRHPDIKLLRQAKDIAKLAILQAEILNALWKTLKPGGILLYATCSIFPEENNQVISAFLQKQPTAELQAMPIKGAKECKIGTQVLPGMYGMDGFYYAKLRKK